jgi:hypothetical protein
MLAIVPAILLTQLDRASGSVVYATHRAKGAFLTMIAFPLAFPFLASLLLLWQRPPLEVMMFFLACGALAAVGFIFLNSRWTRRPRLLKDGIETLRRHSI